MSPIDQAAPTSASRLLTLAAGVVIVCALYFGRELLIPLALTVLFALLLFPLVKRVERWGVGRIGAVILVEGGALLVLFALALFLGAQLTRVAENAPEYLAQFQQRIEGIRGYISASGFGRWVATPALAAETFRVDSAGELRDLLIPILSPVVTIGVVVVLLAFVLVQYDDLRDRVLRLTGYSQVPTTTDLFDDATARVGRYLFRLLIVNAGMSVAFSVGFLLLGLPGAIVWGTLAGMLRFIPFIGAWVGALLPIAIALGHYGDWYHPLAVILVVLVVEIVANNLVEPWFYGAGTGVSAIAIVAAAVFWGWLWGGVGLLLSTPLTVALVVLGRHIPQLEFLEVLLSDRPAIPEHLRFYQRLLALDDEDAERIFRQAVKRDSVRAAHESIILPTLRQVEHDARRWRLDERRYSFATNTVREFIDDATDPDAVQPAGPSRQRSPLLAIPARTVSDELAARVLARSAESKMTIEVLSQTLLASEALDRLDERNPQAVVISAVPPVSFAHIRYISKRIRNRCPKVTIVLVIWQSADEAPPAAEEIGVSDVRIVKGIDEAISVLTGVSLLDAKPLLPNGALRPAPALTG